MIFANLSVKHVGTRIRWDTYRMQVGVFCNIAPWALPALYVFRAVPWVRETRFNGWDRSDSFAHKHADFSGSLYKLASLCHRTQWLRDQEFIIAVNCNVTDRICYDVASTCLVPNNFT